MLKISFWILVAANIVLFAFQQTYFDTPSVGKREPERLVRQYKEDQVRLLSADEMDRAMARAKVSEPERGGGTCIEVGHFNKTEAADFEKQLSPFSLSAENFRTIPLQEGSAYMVFIPPAADQKAAQTQIAALKEKGIESYYLIKDQTRMRGAVSLGVFKTQESAISYMEQLKKKGISDLKTAPRGVVSEKIAYHLENLSAEQVKTLETIMGHFSKQTMRFCSPLPEDPA
jgi:hypothetical protein